MKNNKFLYAFLGLFFGVAALTAAPMAGAASPSGCDPATQREVQVKNQGWYVVTISYVDHHILKNTGSFDAPNSRTFCSDNNTQVDYDIAAGHSGTLIPTNLYNSSAIVYCTTGGATLNEKMACHALTSNLQ